VHGRTYTVIVLSVCAGNGGRLSQSRVHMSDSYYLMTFYVAACTVLVRTYVASVTSQ
jgi:hypothetical protein